MAQSFSKAVPMYCLYADMAMEKHYRSKFTFPADRVISWVRSSRTAPVPLRLVLPKIPGHQLVGQQLLQIALRQHEIEDILPVALLHQLVLPLAASTISLIG